MLQGGASGDNNYANISTNNGAGGQSIAVGSGGIQIIGGTGGSNNTAQIIQSDPSGTQTIAVTGGNVSVLGGAAGNGANIWNNGTAQSMTLTNSNNLNVIARGRRERQLQWRADNQPCRDWRERHSGGQRDFCRTILDIGQRRAEHHCGDRDAIGFDYPSGRYGSGCEREHRGRVRLRRRFRPRG